MAGVWLANIKRKKTIDNGKKKLLKIDGQKSIYQFAVNRIKVFFGIFPMDVELVYDVESDKFGSFIEWEDHFGTMTQLGSSALRDTGNVEEAIKIVLFDAIIGNNDRTSVNLIVRKDFKLMGIDEGESFRFGSPVKCRFSKKVRLVLETYVRGHKKWLHEWIKGVQYERLRIEGSLWRDLDFKEGKEIISEVVTRINNLQALAKTVFPV